jgi:nucleotidyltransferase/DNA polymerase involved in DNA repair
MGERQIRKIIHIDMDAFYASAEHRQPGSQGRAGGGRLRGEASRACRGKL